MEAFAAQEKSRDEEGDRLGMAKKEKREFRQHLFPSFAALYQGPLGLRILISYTIAQERDPGVSAAASGP